MAADHLCHDMQFTAYFSSTYYMELVWMSMKCVDVFLTEFFSPYFQDKQSRSPSPNRRSSPPTHRSRAPKPSHAPPPPTMSMKIESRESSLEQNGRQPLILPKRDSSANLFPTTQLKTKPPTAPQSRPPKPKTPPPAMNGGIRPRSNANRQSPHRKAPVQASKSNGTAPRANQSSPSASPVRSPTPTSPEVRRSQTYAK